MVCPASGKFGAGKPAEAMDSVATATAGKKQAKIKKSAKDFMPEEYAVTRE
jgi:hypothetical protein